MKNLGKYLLVLWMGLMTGSVLNLTAFAHTYSGAPVYTTWSNGQVLTSAALNATLSHVHNTFSGNIDDTMISTAAAIQHSKLQYPALVPKAWAYVAPSCGASPCTLAASSRVTTITRGGAGVYNVTLAYVPTDNTFNAQVTAGIVTTAVFCNISGGYSVAVPNITIKCWDAAGVAADTGFNLTVLDDN